MSPPVAFIEVIDEDVAEGKLFEVYDNIQRTRGRLSNVLRIQSLDPRGLQAHLDLYMAHIFRPGGLGRLEREIIAVVVSAANGCDYCVIHHREALAKHAKDDKWVDQIVKDPTKAKLNEDHRALVDLALGLTKQPGKSDAGAVEALRKAGYSDELILHAVEVVSYFNYVNRMVSGLGVELEQEGDRDYHY